MKIHVSRIAGRRKATRRIPEPLRVYLARFDDEIKARTISS